MECGKCMVYYTYSQKVLHKVGKNMIEQRMKNNKPYGHCININSPIISQQ